MCSVPSLLSSLLLSLLSSSPPFLPPFFSPLFFSLAFFPPEDSKHVRIFLSIFHFIFCLFNLPPVFKAAFFPTLFSSFSSSSFYFSSSSSSSSSSSLSLSRLLPLPLRPFFLPSCPLQGLTFIISKAFYTLFAAIKPREFRLTLYIIIVIIIIIIITIIIIIIIIIIIAVFIYFFSLAFL